MEKTGKFKIIDKIITSKTDVLALKEKRIFNCFGLGSKYIFGDDKLRGIKGHLVQFKLKDY